MAKSPKSAKLLREELQGVDTRAPLQLIGVEEEPDYGPVKIRRIDCLNEFVAVLLFRVKSDIQLPNNQQYRNEGVVVGIGPGLPDGAGGRVQTQLQLGDVVMFQDRSIILDINSNTPPYKNQRVVMISEKSLIARLPKIEFQIVE